MILICRLIVKSNILKKVIFIIKIRIRICLIKSVKVTDVLSKKTETGISKHP